MGVATSCPAQAVTFLVEELTRKLGGYQREKNGALLEKVDKLTEERNSLQLKLRDLRVCNFT